ncbi:MAG: hypothetical protein GWO02_14600 [Gammaproteobacteria bacterium]|nr:hypothetical protein [Gammaproteobacteria bacterium]
MAESESVGSPPGQGSGGEPEKIPTMQRILDNPFLLLFLGVTIPTVVYVIWGIMELTQVPIAK